MYTNTDDYTNCRRIIRALLEPNVVKRLGCLKRGALDIKDSPFFSDVSLITCLPSICSSDVILAFSLYWYCYFPCNVTAGSSLPSQIAWASLLRKKLPAPWIPKVAGECALINHISCVILTKFLAGCVVFPVHVFPPIYSNPPAIIFLYRLCIHLTTAFMPQARLTPPSSTRTTTKTKSSGSQLTPKA